MDSLVELGGCLLGVVVVAGIVAIMICVGVFLPLSCASEAAVYRTNWTWSFWMGECYYQLPNGQFVSADKYVYAKEGLVVRSK